MRKFLVVILLISLCQDLKSQSCDGGQVYSNEPYLYGRYEVAMRSAGGSGIVSSFFFIQSR